MKRLIPIVIMLISISTFAQNRGKMKERIKAQKIAFITEKLNLTSNEAEKFWPVYNAFEASIDAIKSKDLRAVKMEMRNGEDVSDQRAKELLEKLMTAEKDMHTTKLKLVNDLKKVISAKKIIQLKATEDQFNRKLLERFREMKEKRSKRN
jgi:hypothetical protein